MENKNTIDISDMIKIEIDGVEMSYIVTSVTYGKYIEFQAKSILIKEGFPKEISVKHFKNAFGVR